MFSMTCFTKAEKLAGTIKFKEFPRSLGNFKDVSGGTWNINAIIGETVCACPLGQLHPFYTDTGSSRSYGLVQQEWKPYAVEVVG